MEQPFATVPGRDLGARLDNHRGIALVVVLVVMALLSAMGLGLVLTTSLEPTSVANYEGALIARYGAEAGVAIAAHELAAMSDWNPALAGLVESRVLDRADGEISLPDGSRQSVDALTNLANCGHVDTCTDEEMSAFTTERPWGPNNPRWQPFGVVRLDRLADGPPNLRPVVTVVWVADDPADVDGDPRRDSSNGADGARRPGACVVAVRAEAFAARFAHRSLTATVARAAPGCAPGGRLVSWQELP